MARYSYQLFGLTIASQLELPELTPAPAAQPDVQIDLVERFPEGGSAFVVDDVAEFRIRDGRSIQLMANPAAPAANVRLYLLGTAIGILLHQRGDLPLHANSLSLGGGAVAYLGASGAGKSSLAAWMARHGVKPMSDDICVVRWSKSGDALLYPGVPRLRLWDDALVREGLAHQSLAPVFVGDPAYRKFNLAIADPPPSGSGLSLKAVYSLEWDGAFGIEPLSGAGAVDAYFAHTYRGEMVSSEGQSRRHWQDCVKLAAQVPTFAVRRSMDVRRLDRENQRLLAHALDICGEATTA